MHQIITLFLAIFLKIYPLPAQIDLEDFSQDYVLEAKQIHVPNVPQAFNPSIVRWKGKLLMSYREIPIPLLKFNSHIGLVWLDDNFDPISEPQVIDTQESFTLTPSRAEDARLLVIDDRLYIIYSDCQEKIITKRGFRVYIAEIEYDGNYFSTKDICCLSKFEGEGSQRREKNWVPFDYKGNLLLAYSLTPHIIFRPITGTNSCETFCKSDNQINWDWGDLRGGTQALMIDGEYLSFFHSSKYMTTVHSDGKEILHYFMGAYTFSGEPPFEITRMSPEPIIGKNFYHGQDYPPYWKPVRVVFPCGYIFDDNYIWIVYGRQDHESWVVKLDRRGLMNSLVSITK